MSESVERVRAALAAAGHPDTIDVFPDGTRTAQDAANAVGCAVALLAWREDRKTHCKPCRDLAIRNPDTGNERN